MGLGTQEMLIILAIVLVLFGSTKIPELMRGLGSGMREFKKGLNEDEEADANAKETKTP
ncbi:MAG: twin-arginine translocase TatA/TatE family subunit [Chthonomonadales bacterium]|nr:twin-arginine translocase TatA/TatE family subunit [Chthonomonadales bacterium]